MQETFATETLSPATRKIPVRIAIAMSGGGFRAAAFSLGTLSYLNALEDQGKSLLQKVKFIGSTSGGSITNIAYAISVCQPEKFEIFYAKLLANLEGDQLMGAVFRILKDDTYWEKRANKSRNLINAFSIAYDELLFCGKEFGEFTKYLGSSHLEEICINSTEFSNGISFRFQTQAPLPNGRSNGRVGNAYIYFKREFIQMADRLKLGDLLACSSCFSGGFEPFQFPADFTHEALSPEGLRDSLFYSTNPFTPTDHSKPVLQKKPLEDAQKSFGIMDGGVADNQGIDSVLIANNRRKKDDDKFDLILVTDVSSYFMDAYSLPTVKKDLLLRLSIRSWIILLVIVALLLPISLVITLWTGWQAWMSFIAVPSGLLLLLLGKLVAGMLKKTDPKKRKSTWGVELKKYGGYFLHIPLRDLLQLLASRLSSVFLLANDIYLKVIRRLYYQSIFQYLPIKDIIVANAIYDLSTVRKKIEAEQSNTTKKAAGGISPMGKQTGPQPSPPSPIVMAIAEMARLMDTTLWFDEVDQHAYTKAAIVATGQFTTCYNLLKHGLEKNCLAIDTIDRLQTEWTAFNTDPFRLYNELIDKGAAGEKLEAREENGVFIIKPKSTTDKIA